MTAYYNEIEPYAADWLRNLIKEGLIADGEVDTRSIVDVRPGELAGYAQCHFFAGLGGWSGALRLAGVPDTEPLWTGSCPCQPFSLAGKQKGFDDDRHLWPVWHDLIRVRRPAKVFGEQVASASAWLRLVRGDLEALEYAVGAMPIEAASAGADHLRDRFWFVADDDSGRCAGSCGRQGEQPGRAETVSPGNSGDMGHAAGIAEREQDDEGDACAVGGQARPIFGGSGYHSGAVADANGTAIRFEPGRGCGARGACPREHRIDRQDRDLADCDGERQSRWPQQHGGSNESRQQTSLRYDTLRRDMEWVIGADGKARRVKPGIRLLANGVPARVAKLRALGNAIDLRPAAAFIQAAMNSSQHLRGDQ